LKKKIVTFLTRIWGLESTLQPALLLILAVLSAPWIRWDILLLLCLLSITFTVIQLFFKTPPWWAFHPTYTFFQSSCTPMMMVDRTRIIQWVNPKMRQLLKIHATDFAAILPQFSPDPIGKNLTTLIPANPSTPAFTHLEIGKTQLHTLLQINQAVFSVIAYPIPSGFRSQALILEWHPQLSDEDLPERVSTAPQHIKTTPHQDYIHKISQTVYPIRYLTIQIEEQTQLLEKMETLIQTLKAPLELLHTVTQLKLTLKAFEMYFHSLQEILAAADQLLQIKEPING
jgi:hypothetical protein